LGVSLNQIVLEVLYKHTEDVHNFNAPHEVAPYLFDLFKPKSVLDVGCGIGTWLKVFQDLGVVDFLGIDGAYVNRQQLKISDEKFQEHDLATPLRLNRKFDLVLCLEVAEHLSEKIERGFVQTLVSHGDVIVFSAAIPGQGGQNHINEKPLSHWANLFAGFQYLPYDVVRPIFWLNRNIDIWYRQNTVVFAKEGSPYQSTLKKITSPYLDLVHPELFNFYIKQVERASLMEQGKLGLRVAFQSFYKALINII
jgi:SAM-dependent methyltransferase